MLQLIFKQAGDRDGGGSGRHARTLVDLREGQEGVLDRLELPDPAARRLMEMGFVPGTAVTAAHTAPGGDPRVFRVDGSEIALRNETSARIRLRNGKGTIASR